MLEKCQTFKRLSAREDFIELEVSLSPSAASQKQVKRRGQKSHLLWFNARKMV